MWSCISFTSKALTCADVSDAYGGAIPYIYKYISNLYLSLTATVVTERFDVDAFQAEHKQILADVGVYEQMGRVLNVTSAPAAVASIKNEAPAKLVEIATTIPCSTTSLDSAKTISPRNRLAV